jgi:hypothetical protein
MLASSALANSTSELLKRLEKALPPTPQDSRTPKVLIRSPLELTLDQEQRHRDALLDDFRRLSLELGRMNYNTNQWIPSLAQHLTANGSDTAPFFARTALHHLMAQGNVAWRKTLIGGLFSQSNHHMPVTSRFRDQQVARAQKAFFGRRPWFTATPTNTQDEKLTENVLAWTRHEAAESGLDTTLRSTIDLVFTQGYQVVKHAKDTRIDFYKTTVEVVCDADGNPVQALDGDYIYRQDTFVPAPPPVTPFDAPQHLAPPPDAQQLASMPKVLERDGQTPMPPAGPDGSLNFQWQTLRRQNTQFDGVRCENIFYTDFLIGLQEQDVQTATVVFEITRVSLVSLIHALLTNAAWQKTMPNPEDRWQAVRKILQSYQSSSTTTSGNNGSVVPGASQPRPEYGESAPVTTAATEPEITLLIAWKHQDIDDDGMTESTVTMMTDKGDLIYYDYTANMTHDGLRPYTIHTINRVPGRWWGIGTVQKFFELQSLIDLLYNRYLWSISQSGNAVFWNPEKTVEGQANPNLQLNGNTVLKLVNGARPEEALSIIPLHNIKGNELLQAFQVALQMASNMSGVADANDSRMAGLDTAETATGINAIRESGNQLFDKYIADLLPCVQSTTDAFLGLVIFHVDKDRTFVFFAGKNGTLVTLSQMQIRRLKLHLAIDLSQYTGEQRMQQAQLVSQAFQGFAQFAGNPVLAKAAYNIYLNQAKASDTPHVEEIWPKPDFLAALQQPQPMQPGQPSAGDPDPNAEAQPEKQPSAGDDTPATNNDTTNAQPPTSLI